MDTNESISQSTPKGMIYVFDPSPLNWLYVLFNSMEELVRADPLGRIIPNLAKKAVWVNDLTLELPLQKGVDFQNGEPFTARTVETSFGQLHRWAAPHPPGTWLNQPEETTLEIVDDYTVRFHFPYPSGLAKAKFRAMHMGNDLFFNKLGFGYVTQGSGEGHW